MNKQPSEGYRQRMQTLQTHAMTQQRFGKTIRMFECTCGERAWSGHARDGRVVG